MTHRVPEELFAPHQPAHLLCLLGWCCWGSPITLGSGSWSPPELTGQGGLGETPLRPVLLTKPRLLVALHLDGKAKVSQLDGSTLQLGCQQQVLGLQKEMGVGEE